MVHDLRHDPPLSNVVLPSLGCEVRSVRWGHNARTIVVAAESGLLLQVTPTGSVVSRIETGDSLRCMRSDGYFAIVGCESGAVRVWDLDLRKCVATLRTPGAGLAVCSVALSPDMKTVVAGTIDGLLLVWQ